MLVTVQPEVYLLIFVLTSIQTRVVFDLCRRRLVYRDRESRYFRVSTTQELSSCSGTWRNLQTHAVLRPGPYEVRSGVHRLLSAIGRRVSSGVRRSFSTFRNVQDEKTAH